MGKTITSTDLRRRTREALDMVRVEGKSVVVTRRGTPLAALIPYADYQAFAAWEEKHQRRQALFLELRAIAEEVSARASLSDDEVAALIEEAKAR